jgi:8-oxo-dGTP diphosphatase
VIESLSYPTHIVAAGALVSHPDGRVLLVRNERGWVVPGGQIDSGEGVVDSLVREIFEESGVTARVHTLAGVCSNVRPPTKVIFSFLADWVSGDLRPSPETPEVRWVPRADVPGMVTYEPERDRTLDMLNYRGAIAYRVISTRPYAVHFVGSFGDAAAQLASAPDGGRVPLEPM